MPMYVRIISPFLIWCWERFLVTSMWLSFFVKLLLPSSASMTARPLVRMIRSFVYLTIMLLFSSVMWRLWFMIFFSWSHWFTGLLYLNMASPNRWIVIKYKTFNKYGLVGSFVKVRFLTSRIQVYLSITHLINFSNYILVYYFSWLWYLIILHLLF